MLAFILLSMLLLRYSSTINTGIGIGIGIGINFVPGIKSIVNNGTDGIINGNDNGLRISVFFDFSKISRAGNKNRFNALLL
ncbi:hypothetical protein PGB90_004012 [Kerria lacca]